MKSHLAAPFIPAILLALATLAPAAEISPVQERADRFLYNKPETVQTMDLKGPGTSTQAVIDAFNEVFGA